MAGLEYKVSYHEDGKNMKCEEWYLNGKYHRIGGPAITWYHEDGTMNTEWWYLDGKLHRTDGPVVIEYHKCGNTIEKFIWCLGGNKIDSNMSNFVDVWRNLVIEWEVSHLLDLSDV